MGTTADNNGYYTSAYDNAKYASLTVNTIQSASNTFTDGTTVTQNNTYYFKVEPLKWRILSEENGKAFLLCETIVNNKAFLNSANKSSSNTNLKPAANDAHASNWEFSDIREWLNDDFYNVAFSALQKSSVVLTQLDNSTTGRSGASNSYATVQNATNDKVFLLSYADATSTAYGFIATELANAKRQLFASDYSRANGIYMDGCYVHRRQAVPNE